MPETEASGTLDDQAAARIAANVAEGHRLEAMKPPDPPKEDRMSLETAVEQQVWAQLIMRNMRLRAQKFREGPHGD